MFDIICVIHIVVLFDNLHDWMLDPFVIDSAIRRIIFIILDKIFGRSKIVIYYIRNWHFFGKLICFDGFDIDMIIIEQYFICDRIKRIIKSVDIILAIFAQHFTINCIKIYLIF